MQNAPLPSLITAKTGTAANLNKSAAGPNADGNPAFRQALAQQLEQRQNAAALARATPVKPAAAPKPAQPSQAEAGAKAPAPASASRPATSDDTSAAAPATDAADGAAASEAAAGDGDAEAARSADPVADMLALVAAFNQPAAATGTAPAPAIDAASQAGASATTSTASTAGASANGLADSAAVAEDSAAGVADAAAGRSSAADFKAAPGGASIAAAAAPTMDAADVTQPDHQLMPLLAALAGQRSPRTPIGGAADAATVVADAGGAVAATDAAGSAATATTDTATPATATATATTITAAAGNAGANGATATAHIAATIATKPVATGADAGAAGDIAEATKATAAAPRPESNIKAEAGGFGQQLAATRERQAEAMDEAALVTKDSTPAPVAPGAGAVPDAAKAATITPTDKLYSRVGTAAWDQQLGQKVIFMAAGGEHSATMELNPPDLGPLQVVLSVNKDQATAAFTSAAPEVRQALEAALPRLREMMGEAGIALGNATVSAGADQNPGQRAAANDGNARRGASGRSDNGGDGAAAAAGATTTRTVRVPNGAVDTFA